MADLKGKKIAILTEDGFEEVELTSPKKALTDAGAEVRIISTKADYVRGWRDGNWSIQLPVDINIDEAIPEEYDALILPGGVINPDKMRRSKRCIAFATKFLEGRKTVGAICHGPQLLIETGLLKGRIMTSFISIKTDLVNAGVIWEDKEVVKDRGLITSRSPKDLAAFNAEVIGEIAERVIISE